MPSTIKINKKRSVTLNLNFWKYIAEEWSNIRSIEDSDMTIETVDNLVEEELDKRERERSIFDELMEGG